MIQLRRWSGSDAELLVEANKDAMTAFIAGPESTAQVAKRHENYLRLWDEGTARMFVVLDGDDAVGGIGWWETDWEGRPAVETGWFVLPRAQGRGVASAAVALLIDDALNFAPPGRDLFAFPSVENDASNALCGRAGFELTGSANFPFRGQDLQVNVWRFDLAR
ncbi:GNAT family N-acetyltransferase [uncultured Arthrobacter sp.]|uniref:GNAT family N-acetyltransferase n=1 Tax=uncultured Arthrobacter sp. TaxID=114050 RepID=UPI0025ECB22D|nr:GNAT family N-acetyltransferase [uncultured Arthrobacter sp.]